MSREQAYHVTLDAIAKIQWNVAMILEAKATESEKVRNWLCTHLTTDTFTAHVDQLTASMQFNEQQVEIIDGLTKLCNGLTRNMKAILEPEGDSEDMGGMGSLGNMSSLLGGMESGDANR